MLIDQPVGGFRFFKGIAPYSCGVVAAKGFEIVHVTLKKPAPYQQAITRVIDTLSSMGRPAQALCAMQLRLPAPLTFDGFAAFNSAYQNLLSDKGLLLNGLNPVARTNIAPALNPPETPSLYSFSFTIPSTPLNQTPTFIVAGAGDLNDQTNLSESAIVRPGESSQNALIEKAACVMQVMMERVNGLEVDWADAGTVDLYTIYPIRSFLINTVLRNLGAGTVHGIRWQFGQPPIKGLMFEMDLRGVNQEYLLGSVDEISSIVK